MDLIKAKHLQNKYWLISMRPVYRKSELNCSEAPSKELVYMLGTSPTHQSRDGKYLLLGSLILQVFSRELIIIFPLERQRHQYVFSSPIDIIEFGLNGSTLSIIKLYRTKNEARLVFSRRFQGALSLCFQLSWNVAWATETLTLKYLSPEWLQKSNDPECPNLINQKNV